MIVLPAYAVVIWIVIAMFRRRWQAFAILALSVIPVLLLTHLCVQYMPLRAGEPRPAWLYAISTMYGILIVLIGLVIAVQGSPRTARDCHACGYDLSGTTSRTCPECGSTLRCRKCHAQPGPDDPECPICGNELPDLSPRHRATPLPNRPREAPSVLARRYVSRLVASADPRDPERDPETDHDQPDRAADLRRAG